MLDDNKVLIICSNHNHLPPFLLRNGNGTLISSYMMRGKPKNKKKGKSTLGPVATRDEVESLVASIMNSFNTTFHKDESAAANTRMTPNTEATVATRSLEPVEGIASVSNVGTLRNDSKCSVPNTMNNGKINGIDSSVSLSKETTQGIKGSLEDETSFLQIKPAEKNPECEVQGVPLMRNARINPLEENSVQPEVNVVPMVKNQTGLVTNQMYVVLPNNDAIAANNRFILSPQQNTGGLLSNNRILVSPVKTEAGLALNNNLRLVQPVKNETHEVKNNAVLKKPDGTNVVTNKMILVLRNNLAMVPKNTLLKQNVSGFSNRNVACSKETQTDFNESKTFPNIQRKRGELKTSIPITKIKNVILPKKNETGCVVISKNTASGNNLKALPISLLKAETMSNMTSKVNCISPEPLSHTAIAVTKSDSMISSNLQPIAPKIIEKGSSGSSKMQIKSLQNTDISNVASGKIQLLTTNSTEIDYDRKIQPILLKINETGRIESSEVEPIIPKKTIIDSLESNLMQPFVQVKKEIDSAGPSMLQKIALNKIKTGNATENQAILPKKIESRVQSIKLQRIPKKKNKYVNASYMIQNAKNSIETDCAGSSKMQPNAQKNIDTEHVETNKIQPLILRKTKPEIASSNKMEVPKKTETVVQQIESVPSVASDISIIESDINTDWIVPRNKHTVPIKINKTNIKTNDAKPKPANETKQVAENETDFTMNRNVLNVPISVSMIPLPKENNSAYSGENIKPTVSTANDRGSEGSPLVMNERLSEKRKAGFDMYSHNVPPKKRHYSP